MKPLNYGNNVILIKEMMRFSIEKKIFIFDQQFCKEKIDWKYYEKLLHMCHAMVKKPCPAVRCSRDNLRREMIQNCVAILLLPYWGEGCFSLWKSFLGRCFRPAQPYLKRIRKRKTWYKSMVRYCRTKKS